MQLLNKASTMAARAAGARQLVAPRLVQQLTRGAGLHTASQGAVCAPSMSTFASAPRMVCMAAATEDYAAEEDLSNSASIFVSNLSWNTDNQSLGQHLNAIGGVTRVNVMMRDGRSRGMAICDFESPELAQSAVQKLHESDLDGRTINVRIASPRPERPRNDRYERREREPRGYDRGDRYESRGYEGRGDRGYEARGDRGDRGYERREREPRGDREPRGERSSRDPETLLYVGNLSWTTTWQEVKEVFSDAGHPVAFADVKKTAEGRSRGFAIVAMEDAASAAAAAESLNQTEVGGRRINVRRFNTEQRE